MKPAGTASRLRACTVAVILSFVFCLPTSVIAEKSAGFAPLFQRVAVDFNVPMTLLLAIARVESKVYPFTINVEGRPYFFATRAEAIAAARTALAAGKSFDSGIMQINNQWLARYSIPLDVVFDPEANIWLGAWILSQNIKQNGGDLKTAVALYHSPDPARGSHYVSLVKAALKAKSPVMPPVAVVTVPAPAKAQTPELPAIQATAQRIAPQQQPKGKMSAASVTASGTSGGHLGRHEFVRHLPSTFSREPAEPQEVTAAAGFVRRYN